MSSPRRIALVVVALAAAACFALAVQGGRWWTVGEHAIGPTSTDRCFDGVCEKTTLDWTGGGDTWQRAGIATWAAGMISAVVLVALAGALAAKGTGRLAGGVALVSTMTAIVAGAVFHQYRPSLPGLELGRGSYLFGAAILGGLGAAIATLRATRR
jgi:hypothetical protein